MTSVNHYGDITPADCESCYLQLFTFFLLHFFFKALLSLPFLRVLEQAFEHLKIKGNRLDTQKLRIYHTSSNKLTCGCCVGLGLFSQYSSL